MPRGKHGAVRGLRRGRTLVVLTVLVMLTALMVLPGVAAAGPGKVEICHFNADNDPGVPPFELLSVSSRAVDKHLAHGDGFPLGAVPEMPGYVFDHDCQFWLVPVAVDDEVTTAASTPVTVDVLANDSYTGSVVVSVLVFPQHGILGIVDVGVFEYTPSIGFVGTDSFTYQLCDTLAFCDSATVTITVDGYSIGDRVWYDQDQDGIQDLGEPGYNGVTVDLYDNATCSGSLIASTTTSAGPAGFGDGFYQFTNLLAGDYCLQFGNIPVGWWISPTNQGDGTNDSSANSSAQIPNISLSADDPYEDMGVYVSGSVGDSVSCLSTGLGLANITVTLFEDFDADGVADGPAIATTETDATGFYQFSGLQVALAGDPFTSSYLLTVDTSDADLGTCNVPVPPTGYNPALDSSSPDDPDNDFTFEEPTGSIGDTVWEDLNNNGIQEAGEPGLPGMAVNLFDCSTNLIASTTTDGNGLYLFSGLTAGCYEIEFEAPDWYGFSPKDQGADDAVDSDVNGFGETGSISLSAGEDNRTWDAGLFRYALVSGLKWRDYNANGIRDEIPGTGALEPTIPGWYLQSWTYNPSTGLVVSFADRVMTDEDGIFAFEMVTPGAAYMVCEELPTDWILTYPTLLTVPPPGEGLGVCPAIGELGKPLGGVGFTFFAESGSEFLDYNFGNTRPPG